MPQTILIVDDEKNILATLSRALELEGYSTDTAATARGALDKLGADWAKVVDHANETSGKADGPPDVVIVAMLPEAAAAAIRANGLPVSLAERLIEGR